MLMSVENSALRNAIPQILVVDDEGDVGEFIVAAAQSMDLGCIATTTTHDFMTALTPEVTLIIVDLMMPDMDGVELLRWLGQQLCKANIVLMSGFNNRVLESAEELGKSLGLVIVGRLQKPFRLGELENVLRTHSTVIRPLPVTHCQPIAVTDDDFRLAIEREEFVLHYQPQIDIPTGRVVGVEALVRWQHPERGLVFPDNFIGSMESLGLIDQLGWLVAERGLTELRQLSLKDGAALRLALNVSAYSLHDLQFPDTIVALANECGVPPANIILEITESGLIKELSSALDILTRLRMKQVQLSIDDFGTGFAMMQQLRHVPATELKIDKTFVQEIFVKNDARVLVQKIIEMGHDLGMKVIAEGVETAEQLEFLRVNGCDLAQGYLFSRPLPVPELQHWLEASPWVLPQSSVVKSPLKSFSQAYT